MLTVFDVAQSPLPKLPAKSMGAEEAPGAVELALHVLREIAESQLVCALQRLKARRYLRKLAEAEAEEAGGEGLGL